jgi:SAM-dependent methyltransferase
MLGGIACLVPDPALWRTLWLRRLDDYSASIELRVTAMRREAEAPDLLPRTRQRLERMAAGLEQQLEAVTALFSPLDTDADPLPATAIPSRPEAGAQIPVLEYYEHVFRDWVWGQRECIEALDLIGPAIPARLPRVALYGAGAGRLAVELHQRCEPEQTFALDVNPLPFLIADRLLTGEELALPEFPVDPNASDEVVIHRKLTRPFTVREGFSLVFADALRPPFAPGSLDAVVTSWFIDVVRTDLRQTAATINRVLRPGGLWINVGPLRFRTIPSRAYTIEEALEIAGLGCFAVEANDRQDIPYLDSPVSGSRRNETVFRFVARKTGEAPAVEIPDPVPPWVENTLAPIPVTPALIALGRTSMFTSGVLSMIDGTRSITDVARALGAAWGVDPGRLHEELRVFLARLPSA